MWIARTGLCGTTPGPILIQWLPTSDTVDENPVQQPSTTQGNNCDSASRALRIKQTLIVGVFAVLADSADELNTKQTTLFTAHVAVVVGLLSHLFADLTSSNFSRHLRLAALCVLLNCRDLGTVIIVGIVGAAGAAVAMGAALGS